MELSKGGRKIVEQGSKTKELLLVIILFSVGCTTQRNALNRHDRITKNFPFVHTQDSVTLRDTVRIHIDRVKRDTLIKNERTLDTVYLVKDRLTMKYYNTGDTVYLSGECDSVDVVKVVVRKVPVYTSTKENRYLKAFPWLIVLGAVGAVYWVNIKSRRKNDKGTEDS